MLKTNKDCTLENKPQQASTKRLSPYRLLLAIGLSFIICHSSFIPARAQVGTWRAYMSYSDVQQIVKAGDDLFVRASNGLYQYNLTDHSITTYDKVTGLNDSYITHIDWNPTAQRLLIAYDNSNIDLLDRQGNVTNLNALYQKSMTQDKTISNIISHQQYTYLSTGFGIVKIDVQKAEVAESYMLSMATSDIGIADNRLYARVTQEYSGEEPSPFGLKPTSHWITTKTVSTERTDTIHHYRVSGVITAPLTANLINPSSWLATTTYPQDIFTHDTSDYDQYIDEVRTLQPGGPKYNYFGFMRHMLGRLYTCGAGFSPTAELNREGTIQVLENDEWTIYEDSLDKKTGKAYVDVLCLDVDPRDERHVMAGVRSGLYEFYDGKFLGRYFQDNSILMGATASNSSNYVLLETIKYDSEGNLWMLNTRSPSTSIVKYTKDKQWESYHTETLMYDGRSLGAMTSITFDKEGNFWFVNDHYNVPSIYRFNTSSNTLMNAITHFVNQDGASFEGHPQCLAFDKENNLWIGTHQGPLLLEQSQMSEYSDVVMTQVKVPRNDGTNYADYLLAGVNISCIAIDGGNRKWMGTKGSGVYVISNDNIVEEYHFDSSNSGLLSDIVESIAIDQTTGEVFIGTDKGLCSYKSDASESNEVMSSDNVYAYPNPVTPDYTGLITIHGLSFNADVKILNASGKLMAEGRSNGGTFTWNGCDKSGKRVASGVYMVATATNEGKKGTVCKIAIVR